MQDKLMLEKNERIVGRLYIGSSDTKFSAAEGGTPARDHIVKLVGKEISLGKLEIVAFLYKRFPHAKKPSWSWDQLGLTYSWEWRDFFPLAVLYKYKYKHELIRQFFEEKII
jgi:hypothetical protein